MKLVWITNIPLEPLVHSWGGKVSGSGFWMHALLEPLLASGEIEELSVIWSGPCKGRAGKQIVDGVNYYCIHQSIYPEVYGVGLGRQEDRCLKEIVTIIEEIQPDLVHIHGSERFYGRLKSEALVEAPTVVSIQGLTGTVAPCVWGGMSLLELLPYQRLYDAVRNFPLLRRKGKMLQAAKQERLTLQSVEGIIGRTDWDRAHAYAIAPVVPYYHVDEMMRDDFQAQMWAIETTKPNQLFTTANLSLLKGIHILIEAIAILKIDRPDIVLNIAGGVPRGCEIRLFQQLIDQYGVKENIRLLGWLPSGEIIQHMLEARVFVYASLIENGCNSVSEAMLIGMPVVSTFTGGMTTTITHGQTGVLTPRGDAAVLAFEVGQLLGDERRCKSLGSAASYAAGIRHNPQTIVDGLLGCYKSTIKLNLSI